MHVPPLTRGRALALAWPMIAANVAVPLAGLVDTAVIGAVGDKTDLGGVGLGVSVTNVLLFTFYFLRIGSTGLTAQAHGADDRAGVQRILLRALALGVLAGLMVVALSGPVTTIAFGLYGGAADAEAVGARYLGMRILGMPGSYAVYALTGWLIGIGRTRAVLAIHVVFSATNVVLDLVFVLGLGWGVAGVGAATAVADTVAAALGGALALAIVRGSGGPVPGLWRGIADLAALRGFAAMNGDLLIRSWSLLFGFVWFTNSAAGHGTAVLAGNHVLLQIVTLVAFVLEAFAFTAETAVGAAVGARSVPALRRAIRVTSELSLAGGVAFLVALLAAGGPLLDAWIADPEALAQARRFLPWCAVVPVVGAVAWQLDGIFGGSTRTATMRNASVVATTSYVVADVVLGGAFGPTGMWTAFVLFYVARAATLAVGYPALERSVAAG